MKRDQTPNVPQTDKNSNVPVTFPTKPSRASTSRTRVPFPTPPIDGLQDSSPIVSSFCVKRTVRAPVRAAPAAASQPAWPPPITQTTKKKDMHNFSRKLGLYLFRWAFYSPSYAFELEATEAYRRRCGRRERMN
ncbi:hypothetical protein PHLCEN_2v9716 [Hermanssonia centrifuga]|uniref:Uncharacterized protein n=1 Tax=Hermanssonia centrifuga TaxID=98765 RepID=A0A2R6NPU7_9APHY|nr:hypothetical protein PHLCEN_2v9716 [Hermanssonia centrifuga]